MSSFKRFCIFLSFLAFTSGMAFAQEKKSNTEEEETKPSKTTQNTGRQPKPGEKVNVEDVSDEQIRQYLDQVEAKGLSDQDVERLLIAEGYSRQEIIILKERIERIRSNPTGKTKKTKITEVERKQLGELSKRAVIKADSVNDVTRKRETFGSRFFDNANISFEPNLRIATPNDYILGPDDELNIDISGYAYQHYDAKVSPEGTIRIENLSPIFVSGLTIRQAKEKINERLKTLFGGLRNGSLNLDVTLGNIRSIKVSIMGEAKSPGTYTVSSLATVFNALYLCGGPTEIGSLRNIQVFRNNKKIQTVDAYKFIINGSQADNIRLQDQDMILIPVVDRKVEIKGSVRRPGIFELTKSDTFKELLYLAGGFSEQAYRATISVERSTDREKKIISFDGIKEQDFQTQDGDLYEVGTILNRFENRVTIAGAVFRPGAYSANTAGTVKQLVQLAEGLREDALRTRAVVIREQVNKDPLIIPINIGGILDGSVPDMPLQRQDRLVITSITQLREERMVEIDGSVNVPGEYDYVEGMTVKDLIIQSKGLQEGANNRRVEIARRLKSDDATKSSVEIINLDIDKNFEITSNTVVLMPFDKVYIRSLANYEEQRQVYINGEVNYPGRYAIASREERVTDLVKRAGDIKASAYLRGAQVFRRGYQLAMNLEEGLRAPGTNQDLFLVDGDSIIIPKIKETITLKGEVLNPVEVAYQPGFGFQDYIAQAGGFTDSAKVGKTYVRYANGLTDRTRTYLGVIRVFPKVERGMTVFVPTKRRIRVTMAERLAIGTGLTSLTAVILTLLNTLRR